MLIIQPKGLRFVARTGLSNFDWTAGSFTRNGATHTFDMSSIVPKSAKLVMLRIYIGGTDVNQWAGFGPATASTPYDCVGSSCVGVATPNDQQIIVPITNAGLVGYYATAGVNTMSVAVHGWFK